MPADVKHPHPGSIVSEAMGKMNLSPQYVARHIEYPEIPLIRFLNGKDALTADLAKRLDMAGFGSAAYLMGVQVKYDMAGVKEIPHIAPLTNTTIEVCE